MKKTVLPILTVITQLNVAIFTSTVSAAVFKSNKPLNT
jgi:hypothetical protein